MPLFIWQITVLLVLFIVESQGLMTTGIVSIAESLFDNGEWILGVFYTILSQTLKSDHILSYRGQQDAVLKMELKYIVATSFKKWQKYINSCQERMSAGCIFTVIVYHDSKLLQSRE